MAILARIARESMSSLRGSTRHVSSFKSDDLQITMTTQPSEKPDSNNLTFGHHHSDHMLEMNWSLDRGWSKPHIKPLQDLRIHPAAKVFHYAVELYEGLKAYRCVDNKIRLFRPMENMKRMTRTAERASLPVFAEQELLKCIKKLVSVEQEWVPYSELCSLYVRPTMIATEATLGITCSKEAKLFVIAGPVGAYFPTGLKPVRLLADPNFVRAWPGGCGNFKMGSNYAPTIAIQQYALQEFACQQVLWLFGDDQQMTEAGTMNLFVFWTNESGETELITPPLESRMILPGVTRQSLLDLAREWNEFKVTEATITMPRFVKALNEGRVKEVFGAGTACVVCPVSSILYQGENLVIGSDDVVAPLTSRFYAQVNDIHYGKIPHRWMECIEDSEETVLTKTI